MYYKTLRGYLKTISKMGFEISTAGAEYTAKQSKVITICAASIDTGKSLFAALTGLALSGTDKTIVLDLSYKGTSLFNYYEKKITSPLSQKQVAGPGVEELLNDRIEKVNDNLDVLNISFGSKVKVDPHILSPVLFILSRRYKYIVFDVSDYDATLRNYTLHLSDYIYALLKKEKERNGLYELFDNTLRDGQRVYYVINEYYSGDVHSFLGGLVFPKLNVADNIHMRSMTEHIAKGIMEPLMSKIQTERTALILESNMLEAAFYSGLLSVFRNYNAPAILCGSSFSCILLMMHHLADNQADFIKKIKRFFSDEKMNKFLDVTFPDEYIFKAAGFAKFAKELAGDRRLESYEHAPLVLLCEKKLNRKRLFSTGYIKDLMTAAFLLHPVFESIKIGDNYYHSGFPEYRLSVEHLLRTDIEHIVYVSVDNKEICGFKSKRVLPFYREYLHSLATAYNRDTINDLADKNLVIEVAESELRIDRIIETTEKIGESLFKGGI